MILSGTGSRSLEIASKARQYDVEEWISEQIDIHNPAQVMSGMAQGFDAMLAIVAMKAHIPVIAAVPNTSYGEYYWGKNSVTGHDNSRTFDELLSLCADVVYVCGTLVSVKGVNANIVRNQYMVNEADYFLVYQPQSRGTNDCVRRLDKAKVPYTIFA